ncbi:hypothetical protein [Bradyrhizobium jicamae]|uniref:hypothetical protein n=1 Tax=Bradyrhizobium jicamae TaxID=280332 RepID=UPI001BA6C14A|nr:hypothetical protein [Bradyrhizobium jicamae]MBR0936690.1 hypothetical protein [Bradyrhizobium jicamae]
MKFFCHFENKRTGERKDLVSILDADEIAIVERARQTGGDEHANLIAGCVVLQSAYTEIDAREWCHTAAPRPLTLN